MKSIKTFLLLLSLGLVFYSVHFNHYFPHFNDAIFVFEDESDAYVYLWNTWHFKYKISLGENPFFTNHMFYPVGTSLWMHAHTAFFGVINLFTHNPYLAINVGIAISFIFLFLGFTYLAQSFVGRWNWAFLVGYLTTFSTYFLFKAGVHYNLLLMFPAPWILYFVHRRYTCSENKVLQTSLVLFLGTGFSALFDYYGAIYILAATSLFLLWKWFLTDWFAHFTKMKATTLVGSLILGHVMVRLLRIVGIDERGALWAAADIRQLFTPPKTSRFLGDFASVEFPFTNDNQIFIGWGLIVFFLIAGVIFSLSKNRSKATFWMFSSLVLLMVVVPVIKLNGQPLWYNLTASIHFIPFVNHVRAPDRFIPLLIFSMSTFSALVFSRRFQHSVASYMLIGLLLGFSFMCHSQVEMRKLEPTSSLDRLLPTKFEPLHNTNIQSVLVLPFGVRDGYQSFGNFNTLHPKYATEHQKKVVGGYISRVPYEVWTYYQNNTFLNKLVKLQEGKNTQITRSELRDGIKTLEIDAICYPKFMSEDFPVLHHHLYPLLESEAFTKDENAFIAVYRLTTK